MLKAIEIENFKAFGERTRIELAPITLIFGENSGGKSSILQVLSLLKQTRQSREHGAVLLPRVSGGIVDLGSCRDMLFDHDLDRKLSIRLDMENREEPKKPRVVISFDDGEKVVVDDHVRIAQVLLDGDCFPDSIGLEMTVRCRSSDSLELESLGMFVNDQKAAVFKPVPFSAEEGHSDSSESPRQSSKSDAPTSNVPKKAYLAEVPRKVQANSLKSAEKIAAWIVSSLRSRESVLMAVHHAMHERMHESAQLNGRADLDPAPDSDPDQMKRTPSQVYAEFCAILALLVELPREPNIGALLPEGMDAEALLHFYESAAGCEFLADQLLDYIGSEIDLDGFCPDGVRVEQDWPTEPEWSFSRDMHAALRSIEHCNDLLRKKLTEVKSQTWLAERACPESADHAVREAIGKLAPKDWLPDAVAEANLQPFPLEAWEQWTSSWQFSLADRARELLASAINSLYPMGPYRLPPERWYIYSGINPHDVGHRGQYLPDLLLRHPDLVQQTNDWLDRLGIGYRVEPRQLGSDSQNLFELRLLDNRRAPPVAVSLSDVGFGISQLLPFVVQCLASEKKGQIITIEQPEVHVHPRLQADIGDLLIDSIQEPRRHQFIVETHSEHLILRLLRRIRETHQGTLPEGHPGLRPEDVSVIYVRRTDSGSQALKIDIDLNGEFVQPWPDDFFELDFYERFS